jgi:hypothetical protein
MQVRGQLERPVLAIRHFGLLGLMLKVAIAEPGTSGAVTDYKCLSEQIEHTSAI